MEFYTLASSSSGNAALVREGDTAILIDCGISCRRIEQSLAALGIRLSDVGAVLITHEHTDHVNGLATLCKKYHLPVFASRGTAAALTCAAACRNAFDAGDEWQFGEVCIRSFANSHDAADPVGYRIESTGGALGILTDTGLVTDAARDALSGVSTLLLEANHDIETLQSGPYPYFLKRRILGDQGHLSNDTAAAFALEMVKRGTNDILLAHLSKENNTPAMAEYAVARCLQSHGCGIRLGVAPRETISEVHLCRRSPSFASAN